MPKTESYLEDWIATSSDCIRLYKVLNPAENDKVVQPVAELKNNSEYCGPIMSFDWNRDNCSCIATSSMDSTVTIFDIS